MPTRASGARDIIVKAAGTQTLEQPPAASPVGTGIKECSQASKQSTPIQDATPELLG